MELEQLKQILSPKLYSQVEAELLAYLKANAGRLLSQTSAKPAKAGKAKAKASSSAGMPVKVQATKGKVKKVYDSQTAVAKALKVESPTISQALSKGFKVKGFTLSRVSK